MILQKQIIGKTDEMKEYLLGFLLHQKNGIVSSQAPAHYCPPEAACLAPLMMEVI